MKNNGIFISIAIALILFTVLSSRTTNANSSDEINDEIDRVINSDTFGKDCSTDNDCRNYQLCDTNNKCVLSCSTIKCANNTWCNIINHRPTCECLNRYTGDPNGSGCTYMGCTKNDECDSFTRCENNDCIRVCQPNSCGHDAACRNILQQPVCFCTGGTSGDPHDSCKIKFCNIREDCSSWDKCAILCSPICEPKTCGDNAMCSIQDDSPVCTCRNGTIVSHSIHCQ